MRRATIAVTAPISIFYVGINVGAFLAPLVCGTLGEKAGWHYGFAAAGVGMLIGLAIYLYALPLLPADELQKAKATAAAKTPLGRQEWRSIIAILVLFIPVALFWGTYEQQGNTIALWADANTDRTVGLFGSNAEIPTTWFQAFNPFMIFAFTPFVVALWTRQAARGSEPSTITKMSLGCFGVALSYCIMAGAAWHAGDEQASWLWLFAYFRRRDHRRALPLAGGAFAGHQDSSVAHLVDDDGCVAGHEFRRRFSRWMAR